MKSLKGPKKFVGVLHIKSGAIVSNEDNFLPVDYALADFDDCRGTQAAILDGIRNKIREHLLAQFLIAFDQRQIPYFPFDFSVLDCRIAASHNQTDNLIRICGLQLQLLTSEA